MTRTNLETTKKWVVEGLKELGARAEFGELIALLERTKTAEFSPEDYLPQKSHPKDTQFKYMCRWAVTVLRGEGILRRGSPRGCIEIANETDLVRYQKQHQGKRRSPRKSNKKISKPDHTFVGSRPGDWIMILDGKPISPHAWRDLLIEVAQWIGAERLRSILNREYGKWPIIVNDKGPVPAKYVDVPNTPYRVYTHANADLIVRLARFLLSEVGHNVDLLQIKGSSGETPIHGRWVRNPIRSQNLKESRALTAIERHRKLLGHLARYGEITQSERERLGFKDEEMKSWMDSLIVAKPDTFVVSPLFLWAAEGDPNPCRFTTRLASRMIGGRLDGVIHEPMAALEDFVWEHFGQWRLPQPHADDMKWNRYLGAPITDQADHSASEKLDLFAHFSPEVISKLVRDTEFVNDQQIWSAQAANKNLGPLSRQMKIGIRRPLFLSDFVVPKDDGSFLSKDHLQSEVVKRFYVVGGLPIYTEDELRQSIRLTREETIDHLLEHPLYALVVQFEIYRLHAALTNEMPAMLKNGPSGDCLVELNGVGNKPLWLIAQTLLEEIGFWPVTSSVNGDTWESAIRCALINLETIGVMEIRGEEIRVSDAFSSQIKAHPGHPQNRGEKDFRIRLQKFLESAEEKTL